MFRQRLVRRSSSGSAFLGGGDGHGFGPVRQLSPRLNRETFNYNFKISLTSVRTIHVLKPVFPHNSSRWAESTPTSVSRRPAIGQPISLTPKILHTREYARRRAGPSPSVGDRPLIIHPEPPEPELPLPDPEEHVPKKQIKYIERGFLAVFVLLYLLYESTNSSVLIQYKKELSKQIGEIPEGNQRKISIHIEGLKDPIMEAHIQHMVNLISSKDEQVRNAMEEPLEHDVQEVEIRLPEFTTLYKIMHEDFRFSPSKLFPIDGLIDSGFRPWTAVTSSLLHGNLFHLVACYFSLKVFTRDLIFLYGPKRFFQLFFAGAGLAATLYAGAERLFTPLVNMTPEQQERALLDENADPKERNAVLRYYTPSVGSSGAIIALGTICTFVAPWIRASILLSPAFSIRTIMSILFAFDVGGQFFFDYGLNINHGVHLGGYAAGYILYRTMVKKWPYSPNYQKFLGTYYAARMPINMH